VIVLGAASAVLVPVLVTLAALAMAELRPLLETSKADGCHTRGCRRAPS
jgi:hypothetical protein